VILSLSKEAKIGEIRTKIINGKNGKREIFMKRVPDHGPHKNLKWQIFANRKAK
jgi:hypothetical protein